MSGKGKLDNSPSSRGKTSCCEKPRATNHRETVERECGGSKQGERKQSMAVANETLTQTQHNRDGKYLL